MTGAQGVKSIGCALGVFGFGFGDALFYRFLAVQLGGEGTLDVLGN